MTDTASGDAIAALAAVPLHRMLAQYCHRVDTADFDGFCDLFWDDATVTFGRQEAAGREAIGTWVRGVKEAIGASRHLCTNAEIDVDGDRARSLSDWLLVAAGPAVAQVGRYEDTFERRGGEWRFSSRTITLLRPPKGDGER